MKSQFLQEINFKLDLLPELTSKIDALPKLVESVTSVEAQLAQVNVQLKSNAEANEKLKSELILVRQNLQSATLRADRLEDELRRSNVIIYNFEAVDPRRYTLSEEIMKVLNDLIPNLRLTRSDVRDSFRLKAGPIVLKLNSMDVRNMILRGNPLLREYGLSAAPDYSPAQREARKHLRVEMNKALSEGQSAYLRGFKLYVNDVMFKYDELSNKVIKETPRTTQKVQKARAHTAGAINKGSEVVIRRNVGDNSGSDATMSNSDAGTVVEVDVNNPAPTGSKTYHKDTILARSPLKGNDKKTRKLSEVISPEEQSRGKSRNVSRRVSPTGGWPNRVGRYVSRGPRGGTPYSNRYRDYYRITPEDSDFDAANTEVRQVRSD